MWKDTSERIEETYRPLQSFWKEPSVEFDTECLDKLNNPRSRNGALREIEAIGLPYFV